MKLQVSFKPTWFRIITTIVLFAVIISPILVYDDMFFAAPWIWYVLAPPIALENQGIFAWLALPLMIIWFYFFSILIEQVRKSR